MKNFLLISMMAILLASNASAKVWTVNNQHGAADFTTLQHAIDGASHGDTLYMEGSTDHYGSGTLDKKLCIIGPGYFLEENDSTQANKNVARVTGLIFNDGSQGSEISGLYVYYGNYGTSSNWKTIRINTDSITIARNRIYGFASAGDTYQGYIIFLSGVRNNINIFQNWIETKIHDNDYTYYNGAVHGIYYSDETVNCKVKNNFIRSYKSGSYGSAYSIRMVDNEAYLDYLKISNNVIWGAISTNYAEITNNILLSGSYNDGFGDGVFNNLCHSDQFPPTNGNQQNVVMDSVFVDYELYIDHGYYLKPNSPARNAGINGGDCGVFSNDTGPGYVLSGIPAIPSIFEVNAESYGEETIPVNIKAKSNN